jgi:hypothetical protein
MPLGVRCMNGQGPLVHRIASVPETRPCKNVHSRCLRRGFKLVELRKKRAVVDVVGPVAGERHVDHAVDQVDRRVAQVDGLVGQAQPLELREGALDVVGIDDRRPSGVVRIGETAEKAVLDHLLAHELFITERVARKPAGQLAGRIMDLGVKHALPCQQGEHDPMQAVDRRIEQALDALLLEQKSAHRGIALDLQPAFRHVICPV